MGGGGRWRREVGDAASGSRLSSALSELCML